MDAHDPAELRHWSTASDAIDTFDRLAYGVLRAAREAARELRRNFPDPGRRINAVGKLARQTQAMLGPDLPAYAPAGVEAQEEFVRTAHALAVHVRSRSWANADLGAAGVRGRPDVPHSGERGAADTFDALGRLMLPEASPAGWTATLVTDLARGDSTLEAAVKLGKYILHPTFLAVVDDTTRVIGEALHNRGVSRLQELADSLRAHAGALESSPSAAVSPTSAIDAPATELEHWSVTEFDRPSVTEFDDPSEMGLDRPSVTEFHHPSSTEVERPDSPRSSIDPFW
ncbi:hypothetical protein [Streptomyces sp. Tue6028]|uniref:hypothetical protein n=1 Tax=Streptomyces sp. Tue6028 TaxID=2036037 RepID=UPI003D7457FC